MPGIIQYHISRQGVLLKVLPENEVGAEIAAGNIQQGDLCWKDGMAEWKPVFEVLERPSHLPGPSPLPVSPYQPPMAYGASPPAPVQAAAPRMGDDLGMRLLLPVGRSGWAIAAGYLGLFSLMILPGPLALICSIIAIRDIRKSARTSQPKFGMGRAVFGLIMGIIGTAIIVFWLMAALLKD